jgi:pimeloyl-ACP methyl ester carboxylesterase
VRTELISIPTDGVPLDGLWYEPAPDAGGGTARGAVQLFHGNTMNFYTGAPRFLPPALVPLGFACLAYNRRGHDILGIRDSRAAHGAAFQTIAESVADNVFARAFIAGRGHAAPIVAGHSNGGMLAVRHVADHPDTPALVLLSAHKGGTGLIPDASKTGLLAQDRFDEITARAQELVAAGRGREIMALPGWWYAASAESWLDLCANMPDIIELAPRISCPVLFLRGDREPAGLYPMEAFAEACTGPCETVLVPDCDHFYVGREDAVAAIVADWLSAL